MTLAEMATRYLQTRTLEDFKAWRDASDASEQKKTATPQELEQVSGGASLHGIGMNPPLVNMRGAPVGEPAINPWVVNN